MNSTNEIFQMLSFIQRPAFFVGGGMILRTNEAAAQHLITADTPVAELFAVENKGYSLPEQGSFNITLLVGGKKCSATVNRVGELDLFVLDADPEDDSLQGLLLASTQLRQSLHNVMIMCDLLFPTVSAEDMPRMEDQISRINRGLFQLNRLVNNMSDITRYSQERSCFTCRDISTLVESYFRKAADLLAQNRLEIRFTGLTKDISTLVDEEKLERAVYNILANAAAHTPAGGQILAKLTRHGKMLQLTVQDTGSGVASPEVRSQIYNRYQRQPGVSAGGLGLGMTFVRLCAAAHNGTVLTEFPETGGTRVTMTMEIRQPAGKLRSPIARPDYAGHRDHCLMELSGVLPATQFRREDIN